MFLNFEETVTFILTLKKKKKEKKKRKRPKLLTKLIFEHVAVYENLSDERKTKKKKKKNSQ